MAQNTAVLLSSFSHLLVSQVFSRLVTFALNLVVTRLLSPEAYALAAVQFHLINTVILFLSREGFRRGCLRSAKEGDHSAQAARRTLATSALCVPIGLIVTVVTCRIAYGWQDAGGDAALHRSAVRIQGFAALIELVSEPLYILAAVQLRFRLRAIVDTAAIMAKSAVTVALLQLSSMPSALALSWAQVVFAGVTLISYSAAYAQQVPSWLETAAATPKQQPVSSKQSCSEVSKAAQLSATSADDSLEDAAAAASADSLLGGAAADPGEAASLGSTDGDSSEANTSQLRQRRLAAQQKRPQQPVCQPHQEPQKAVIATAVDAGDLFHGPTLWLCGGFSMQAAEKLVLAEGSKMVLVGAQSAYAQGVYGLVVNLGSLVVRTVFQPFEEAAFTAFATSSGDKEQQGRLLSALVRSVTIVGLISAAFGPAYAYLVLRVLYSQRWSQSDAPAALAAYSAYILLLAANGILEAFVHAAANHRQLAQINVALVGFAAAHMALSWALVRKWGALGLILADGTNMMLRIGFSVLYIRSTFKGTNSFKLRSFLPSRQTFSAVIICFAVTGISASVSLGAVAGSPLTWMQHWRPWAGMLHRMHSSPFAVQAALHVSVGGACLAALAVIVRRAEHSLWAQLRALRSERRAD